MTEPSPPPLERSPEEMERLLAHVRARALEEEDYATLEVLVPAYGDLLRQIGDRKATIRRLRHLVFGDTSETSKKVLGEKGGTAAGEARAPSPLPEGKPKPRGHGRNGATAYPGAERVPIPHETLHAGDSCPRCPGRLHALPDPARLVRIRGLVPFAARVYEPERLRCALCGEVFTAKAPEGVGEEKYDATAVAMVAVLRYGSGLPFHRIANLQALAGVPFPASTQWDVVDHAVRGLLPVLEALRRLAAQGEVVHNDDTPMVILSYLKEEKERRERGEAPAERTGVFTTGIVALVDGRKVILYATGHNHAGENLFEILALRAPELGPPIQMCDGLDRNLPTPLATIVSNCLAHGRRQFVDVVESFPDEVRHVLEELAIVYRVDARTKVEGMSPAERLRLHQQESGPVMERLRAWLLALLAEKKVEPNSGLGDAIAYVEKRWDHLTLFLRREGAPLDNSLCERILKRAILHRKNSMFYRTDHGARVGDVYMSLIATAWAADVDPFAYLTELLRHPREVAEAPGDWLPWTYRATMGRDGTSGGLPAP